MELSAVSVDSAAANNVAFVDGRGHAIFEGAEGEVLHDQQGEQLVRIALSVPLCAE